MSANSARKYDEKVNPEKYYELKALEKLAIESGNLERPGIKHLVFGGDILGGGIGDYGKKLNTAIADLAPRVGAPEGIEYTSPRAALNDLNFATRGINRAVTFAEEGVSSLVGNATRNYERLSGRIFDSSSPQESAREEEPRPAETLFTRIWNFLFGPSNNNSRSTSYSAPSQPAAPREESEGDIGQASAQTTTVSAANKGEWTNKFPPRNSKSFAAIALEESKEPGDRGSR